MPVHAMSDARSPDALTAARIDLAAAHRLAVLHGLDEAIDNHFTVTVPGRDDRFLGLPYGLHWSEACASGLVVFDEQGRTLEGEGAVELSTWCIHAPVHHITGAPVVLHTHQTWTLALNMLDDNRLVPSSQSAAYFHGRIAYDDHYAGTADFPAEGERLARCLGDGQHTLFMKNHGVLVTGASVAQAYRRLYSLERICKAQVLAMSTGRPLAPLAEEIIAQVQAPAPHDTHARPEREALYFEAMKRVLQRQSPGYAD